MGWVDGVNKNSGDVISAALWTSYLGAGDGIDAMETAKVTTAGDIVYATGDNALSRLGIGSARQVLQMNAGVSAPEYAASAQSVMTAKGDILAASGANTMTRLAVGSDGQVLTAASGQASGLSWAAAPGATNAASNECVAAFPNNTYRTNANRDATANRIYFQVLNPPTQAYTLSEFITGTIGSYGSQNYIISIYSFDNSTLTRRATSGSTVIPSPSADITKLPLSFQVTVGSRYAMAYSSSGDASHVAGTNDTDNTNFTDQKGSSFYYDPGSFIHNSSLAWSATTNDFAVSGPLGVWNNGGIFT